MTGKTFGLLLLFLLTSMACSGGRRVALDGGGGSSGGGADLDAAAPSDAAADGGRADAGRCPAGVNFCEDGDFFSCAEDGATRTLLESCAGRCESHLGCVVCSPGTGRCDGQVSSRCSADGQRYDVLRDCAAEGSVCGASGFCDDACGAAERVDGNVGCRFSAVPLLNHEVLGEWTSFRVTVGNTDPVEAANVTIVRGERVVAQGEVPPGGAQGFTLPWIEEMTFRIGTGYSGDAVSLYESFATPNGVYEIRSDRPVVAYQHAPGKSIADAGTGDASLLLPHHALSGRFRAISWPPHVFNDRDSAPPYVVVAPAGQRRVSVEVTSPVALVDAAGLWSGVAAGDRFSFDLEPNTVVHILPVDPRRCAERTPGAVRSPYNPKRSVCPFPDHDLTGLEIRGDGPLVVFSGHFEAQIPIEIHVQDHLEEQVPPVEAWGSEYVLAPVGDFGKFEHREQNVARILGGDEAIQVSFRPAIDGMLEAEVPAGEFLQIRFDRPVTVESEDAFLVAQFMVGSGLGFDPDDEETPPLGDPSMFHPPPVDQFRNRYAFSVEDTFPRRGRHYVVVIRPRDSEVTLDGEVLGGADWRPAGAGGYQWRFVEVEPGPHLATSENSFGLVVSGVGHAGSYAYAGGTDLRNIVDLR